MKNLYRRDQTGLRIRAAVAADTVSGDVALVGDQGLVGACITDRATTATIADGTAAPGLSDGEATVVLNGFHESYLLTVDGGVSQGDKVYRVTADGTYNASATGAVFIGWALADIADGEIGEVALAQPGA